MREKPKADETNNYAYNKRLRPLANNLRKKMTKDVLKNMSGVIQRIEKMVDAIGLSGPPPAPPPAGDMEDSTRIRG